MDSTQNLEDTGEHTFSLTLSDDVTDANAYWGRVSNYGVDADSPVARAASERADAAGRELSKYRTAEREAQAGSRIGKFFARLGLFDN